MSLSTIVFLLIFGYFLGGALSVITVAYLRKLLYNENWFTEGTLEWTELYPPPLYVFLMWPVINCLSIIVFFVGGIAAGVSKLAEKAEKAAEARRKRLGDHRDNPK